MPSPILTASIIGLCSSLYYTVCKISEFTRTFYR